MHLAICRKDVLDEGLDVHALVGAAAAASFGGLRGSSVPADGLATAELRGATCGEIRIENIRNDDVGVYSN